jgi:hypothetical protein
MLAAAVFLERPLLPIECSPLLLPFLLPFRLGKPPLSVSGDSRRHLSGPPKKRQVVILIAVCGLLFALALAVGFSARGWSGSCA